MTTRQLLRLLRKRRLLALIAGLLAVVLVLSIAAARSTLAGWTATESSQGKFAAGSIGEVGNLQCVDSDDVLGTGLLNTQVKLTWNPPSGVSLDDKSIEYLVTWQAGLLGQSGSAVVNSPTNGRFEHTYTSSTLLAALTVNFTVRARTALTTDSWEGQPQSKSATTLVVIVPVLLNCN